MGGSGVFSNMDVWLSSTEVLRYYNVGVRCSVTVTFKSFLIPYRPAAFSPSLYIFTSSRYATDTRELRWISSGDGLVYSLVALSAERAAPSFRCALASFLAGTCGICSLTSALCS